jgi:arylsulfatase A-like enzyme
MPDVLASDVAEFITTAPGGRPFFAVYAPTAPHAPWVPAPGNANAFASDPPEPLPNFNEKNVSDKPEWVQALPRISEPRRQKLAYEHRLEFDALLGMDDGVRTIFQALQDRGVLEDTVVIYLTDNGYSFGSHRWVGKRCEYDECTHTPFLVWWPGAEPGQVPTPVSNADIAPTLAQLAGVEPGLREDGTSLVPLLAGSSSHWPREGVLLEWPGDEQIPQFWAVRTERYLYAELATGERELYDLTGVHGEADPWMLHNVFHDRGYAKAEGKLAALLAQLRAGATMPSAPDLPPWRTPQT